MVANKLIGVTNEWKYFEIKCGNELDGDRKTTKLVIRMRCHFSMHLVVCNF